MEKDRIQNFQQKKILLFNFSVWQDGHLKKKQRDADWRCNPFFPIPLRLGQQWIFTPTSASRKLHRKKKKANLKTQHGPIMCLTETKQNKKTTLCMKWNERRQAHCLFSIRHIFLFRTLCSTGLICLRRGLGVLPWQECKAPNGTQWPARWLEMCVQGCPGSEKPLCTQKSAVRDYAIDRRAKTLTSQRTGIKNKTHHNRIWTWPQCHAHIWQHDTLTPEVRKRKKKMCF